MGDRDRQTDPFEKWQPSLIVAESATVTHVSRRGSFLFFNPEVRSENQFKFYQTTEPDKMYIKKCFVFNNS